MKNLYALMFCLGACFLNGQSKIETTGNHCHKKIELCFLIDATGSMRPVMEDLKNNIGQILGDLRQNRADWEIEISAVLFRDRKEEYLTRVFEKTTDLKSFEDFLKGQFAVGGGDESEGLLDALHETIDQIQWSKNLNPKIILLLTDNDSDAKIAEVMDKAEVKAISIVPMRYEFKKFSFCEWTPIVQRYIEENAPKNPEVVNSPNLITEKINDFLFEKNCNFKKPTQKASAQIEIFPNPTSDFFTLTLPEGNWTAELQTVDSKTIETKHVQNSEVWQVNQLVLGVYFLKISDGTTTEIKQIVIARK